MSVYSIVFVGPNYKVWAGGASTDTKPTYAEGARGRDIAIESDTKDEYKFDGVSAWSKYAGPDSSGNLAVNTTPDIPQLAQERNPGTSNQYGVGVDESNGSLLDDGTAAQAVSAGSPALLFGVYITTALTGTLTITGLTNVTGTATDFVIPVGAVGFIDFNGAKCNTALVCTKSSAVDNGLIVIFWRPQ